MMDARDLGPLVQVSLLSINFLGSLWMCFALLHSSQLFNGLQIPKCKGRNLRVLRYCPSADEWSVFDVCKQHVRKQQMVSLEETLFLVGGYVRDVQTGESEDSLSVRSYNTKTRSWNCLKVNTSKSGLSVSCTLHNDGIYILSRDMSLSTGGRHRVFLKYCVFSGGLEYVRGPPTEGNNMQLCSMYLTQT